MGLITYENLEDGQKVTANVFNERFAQIVAQLNGNLDESNFANQGISKEKLKAEVYESLYPVGSMYVNFTNNTNPATLLGFGVWTAVAGRVIVGYDAAQTEFNAAEKTGGSKNLYAQIGAYASTFGMIRNAITFTANVIKSGFGESSGSNSQTGGAKVVGETDANTSLPPYVVGYVWKRTS